MTTAQDIGRGDVERATNRYRRLLVVYPSAFRNEYGDDLVQAFGDLLTFGADRRATWWRTLRDLVPSAFRERAAAVTGGKRPSPGGLLVLIALVVAVGLVGPGLYLPVIVMLVGGLVGLPLWGLGRFRRAWIARRATGASVARPVLQGIAAWVPSTAFLVWSGEDSAYYVGASIALAVIAASVLGIVWGLTMFVVARREAAERGERDRRRLPLVATLVGAVVLAVIIGASYNSYRNSLGPPGDHSVENASADTRALWGAAGRGDVDEVKRLTTDTCADPWVKFPVGDGRHNAKGYAEERMLQVADDLDGDLEATAEVLGDYMDVWNDRCNGSR